MTADSWPRSIPTEKVKPTCSSATFSVVISANSLYRVLAKFFAGIVHWPSSGGAAAGGGRGTGLD
jgi:hypothetical protein